MDAIRNERAVPDLLVDGYEVEDEDDEELEVEEGIGDIDASQDSTPVRGSSSSNNNSIINRSRLLHMSPLDGMIFAAEDADFINFEGISHRLSFGGLSPIPHAPAPHSAMSDMSFTLRHHQDPLDTAAILDEDYDISGVSFSEEVDQ